MIRAVIAIVLEVTSTSCDVAQTSSGVERSAAVACCLPFSRYIASRFASFVAKPSSVTSPRALSDNLPGVDCECLLRRLRHVRKPHSIDADQ